MIGIWVIVIIAVVLGIFTTVVIGSGCKSKAKGIAGILITLGVTGLICGGMLWYLYGTEAGERTQKTFYSNTQGGIERTVTVYDINGEIIAEYNGMFDVTYDESRILFDDEDGLRHVIYYTTGTVIIDEIGGE